MLLIEDPLTLRSLACKKKMHLEALSFFVFKPTQFEQDCNGRLYFVFTRVLRKRRRGHKRKMRKHVCLCWRANSLIHSHCCCSYVTRYSCIVTPHQRHLVVPPFHFLLLTIYMCICDALKSLC